jgi:carbon-monoxide dehydrogenase large subunit
LLRGRGISLYLEATGPQGKEMGGIRFDGDGGVTMITGTLDYGQGHASAFAQVLVDRLGIPFDRLRLLQGDSDALIAGGGTGGSKSLMSSGEALVMASAEVIEKGKVAAARFLEAAMVDIGFAQGRFSVVGTDRSVGLMELAAQPDADLDASLVAATPPSSYPNGCHVAEVEIDPETGVTQVVRYAATNDFGVVVNPLLVEGQVQGGVVQGIGQVLGEAIAYDDEGQMLTGSFMDYAMPRAGDAPWMRIENLQFPAKTNSLGVKGCGEAGCAGAIPAVMGAVVDALGQRGISHFDMPATPERVWRALHGA